MSDTPDAVEWRPIWEGENLAKFENLVEERRPLPLIAYLTDNMKRALNAIHADCEVVKFNHSTASGVIVEGGEHKRFRVYSDAQWLKGATISEYRIIGLPDPYLVEVARSMMR